MHDGNFVRKKNPCNQLHLQEDSDGLEFYTPMKKVNFAGKMCDETGQKKLKRLGRLQIDDDSLEFYTPLKETPGKVFKPRRPRSVDTKFVCDSRCTKMEISGSRNSLTELELDGTFIPCNESECIQRIITTACGMGREGRIARQSIYNSLQNLNKENLGVKTIISGFQFKVDVAGPSSIKPTKPTAFTLNVATKTKSGSKSKLHVAGPSKFKANEPQPSTLMIKGKQHSKQVHSLRPTEKKPSTFVKPFNKLSKKKDINVTIPVPFSFEKRDKALQKKKEEFIKQMREEERRKYLPRTTGRQTKITNKRS